MPKKKVMSQEDFVYKIEEMQRVVARAQATITQQKDYIDRMMEPPHPYALVVKTEPPKEFSKDAIKIGDRFHIKGIGGRYEGTVVTARGRADNVGEVPITMFDGEDSYTYAKYLTPTKPPVGTAVILFESSFCEVNLPKEKESIRPGDWVLIHPQTMQIINVAKPHSRIGDIAYYKRRIDNDLSEVIHQGTDTVVYHGDFALEESDRVVLDKNASVILESLGKDEEVFKVSSEVDTSWNQIGGLENAKRELRETVELPRKNPDIFKFYNKKPAKGILLYGPPGCGKTLLVKATATTIKSHGFLHVKGPEILDKYVGVAEATIRQLFKKARDHKEAYGHPGVIFIDEAESLLARRGSGISSDIERTIVPMFLAEMDGLEESNALVILATNRPDILDPAIVRDGRIDKRIEVTRPQAEDAESIFKIYLKGIPRRNGSSVLALSNLGVTELYKPERVLYEVLTRDGDSRPFAIKDIVSGGMIAGIVDRAVTLAMRRDIEKNAMKGICKEDLIQAIDITEDENRNLDHTEVLASFVEPYREEVVAIKKVRV